MANINLKHLRYFWAVAANGSIARASEILHLTPQTISSQLRELEEQIGSEAQELRSSLQEQGEELSSVIQETHEELSQNLSTETRNLADEKLARDDMAALLTEVALRLKKDFKLPDA